MTLKNAFPWRVDEGRTGDRLIFDANNNWTGIIVTKLDTPEGYDAEEIAQAIVEAMNPAAEETLEDMAAEALSELVECWHFPEEALKDLDSWELVRMKQKIDEAGWDPESAGIRAEMFADDLDIELEESED